MPFALSFSNSDNKPVWKIYPTSILKACGIQLLSVNHGMQAYFKEHVG